MNWSIHYRNRGTTIGVTGSGTRTDHRDGGVRGAVSDRREGAVA